MAKLTKYGLEWSDPYDALQIEMYFIRKGGQFKDSKGKLYGNGLFYHYREMQRILWPTDDFHRWSDMALKSLVENEITVLAGCSDCVAGHTRIWNPQTRETPTIKELCESGTRPVVMTLNGPELAGVPYLKGEDELFEITCRDGNKFTATGHHRVLTSEGYSFVSHLQIGQFLVSYDESHQESILAYDREVHTPSALNCSKRLRDFQDGCRREFRSYDERLRLDEEAVQASVQRPNGVRARKSHSGLDLGDRVCKSGYSHSYPQCAPLSTSGSCHPESILEICGSHRFSQGILSRDFQSYQLPLQCPSAWHRCAPFPSPNLDFSHIDSCGLMVSKTAIESIIPLGKGVFYDIQVPNSHHYFAEGFIHHNSGKTYSVSKYALCDYWCFPNETLWLLSSTEGRGAELRVWGEIKSLFNRAKERFDLPGYFLESIKALTTQEIDDEKEYARDLRTGMIFVPCKKGSSFVGLSAFVGVKSKRLRHAGDEVQFMEPAFLSAYSNWYGKPNFKGSLCGNPADIGDPLCTAAEPKDGGWDNFVDTGKTQEWDSKFYNAHVIAFDGRDSPNFDYPADQPQKYGYLIGPKKLNAIKESVGEDSWEWWQQGVGKPSRNMALYRVITAELCRQHGAHDYAQWLGTQRTLIYAIDPAYGGGDRCVGGCLEFGMGLDRQQILKIHPYELIPIKLNSPLEPEQQIAKYVKRRLEELGIPVENCFYDSFGKGTLGYYFSEEFKEQQPIPIDSGSSPSDRPVRLDMFVVENDKQRLMRCDERYSKFVTEMWYSVREAIVCNQLKELPKDVMKEGAARIYRIVKGNKIEVEPKDEMKERLRYSPDLFDQLAIGVEGARRRGFEISKLGKAVEEPDHTWLDEESDEQDRIIKNGLLQHSTYGGLLKHAA